MNIKSLKIRDRNIGLGSPCFVIAEAGVNHNGKIEMAKALIDLAKTAGADAVKFQTFRAENLVSPTERKARYQVENTGTDELQFEMLKALELSGPDFRELARHCREKEILFLSTPFDEESADLLAEIDVAAYKISSGDVTNLPFLRYVAGKRKPIIFSTGMAVLSEVETALKSIRATGNREVIVLHCVTNYPADPHDINLRAMETIARTLGVLVGLSDHTLGIEIPIAAVALGARVIEKHFTLDRSLPGPDHQTSLDPSELKALVRGIRNVEAALGDGIKRPAASELENLPIGRKSLHWRRSLTVDAVVSAGDLIALRPGSGIPPSEITSLLGKRLICAVEMGTIVRRNDFQK